MIDWTQTNRMQATIGANPKTSHDTNIVHEYKMDDDEIQVVEVTVRVYRYSSTVIVSSYIRVELWWWLKQTL